MDYILKTETDSTAPTRIFCMALIDPDSGTVYEYADSSPKYPPITDGIARLAAAGVVISHTQYHRKVVRDLHGLNILDDCFLDTFDACRRLFADIALDGKGHGLTAWAERLGKPRVWDGKHVAWTQAMQDRCRRDSQIVHTLYQLIELEMANTAAAA